MSITPQVRSHMFVIGAVMFVAAALVKILLPDLSVWSVVLSVTVAHVGLVMLIGGSISRWFANHRGSTT